MMGAIMACNATAPITIRDAGCVAKSYPAFWETTRPRRLPVTNG
jgi:5-enolpyruvylshikimate-3-phosphate synthase